VSAAVTAAGMAATAMASATADVATTTTGMADTAAETAAADVSTTNTGTARAIKEAMLRADRRSRARASAAASGKTLAGEIAIAQSGAAGEGSAAAL